MEVLLNFVARKAANGFLITLFLAIHFCMYTDGHDEKLDAFKKEYARIAEVCTAVGFCRCCSAKDGQQKVAFTTAVTSSSTTWNGGTLVFNSVITNVGNGYNQNTGIFTAPLNGTYVFTVAAIEYSRNYLCWDIVLNNVSKVRIIGDNGGPFYTATNTVVLTLKYGDKVWVKHMQGKGYYTAAVPMVTFTGFMI